MHFNMYLFPVHCEVDNPIIIKLNVRTLQRQKISTRSESACDFKHLLLLPAPCTRAPSMTRSHLTVNYIKEEEEGSWTDQTLKGGGVGVRVQV